MRRVSDGLGQSYDIQNIACNAPPPQITNALSQLYNDSSASPAINERLVVCFTVPSLPQDVNLFTIRDSRTGIVHSFDVAAGSITVGPEANGWTIDVAQPGTLEPTYSGGPSFSPTGGTAYYITTDVDDLLSVSIFDLTLTLYDRGGLTSTVTIPSRLRKLNTPTCSITTMAIENTFAQPYVEMTIYAPSNASDATLHFAVEDGEGNLVADTRGNIAQCVGSASFRLYPQTTGLAKTYKIIQAYATKTGWLDSDDGASACGSSGTVVVTGKQLEDPIASVAGGSSVPQDTEFVFTSPQGTDLDVAYDTVPATHINVKSGPSPVSVTLEAAAKYQFAVMAYKDYYQNSAHINPDYTVVLSKIYVASYGLAGATGTIDDPLDSIANAMTKFTTPGVVGTIYVLDDLSGAAAMSSGISVGSGNFVIVGCKDKVVGSSVKLNTATDGSVISISGGSLALRAIEITENLNSSNGAIYVSGGSFIVRDKVRITGNKTVGGVESNVCLAASQTITIDQANLSGTMVGVTTATAPTAGHPVTITSGYTASGVTDAPKSHFASDASGRAILLDATGDDAVIATGGGGIDIDDPVTVSFDKTASG
ncbi:MAG: hypothetical protein J5700_03155, partial [Treponema sp.]|nr:hypothetical protein [Treponema sp.]